MATVVPEKALTSVRFAWPASGALAALAATVVLVLIQAMQGIHPFANINGDSDSLMRLVEVRDLIAGQGWFDLNQYRMGPPGGFEMHWSRLVDAPIAALVLIGAALTGEMAAGEAFAALVWPSLLFFLSTCFLIHAAHSQAGPAARIPAVLIGGTTLYATGMFSAGSLDHHNVQITLTMAMTALLAAHSGDTVRARGVLAAAAGCCATIMLAVAAEAMPMVAAGGLAAALLFVLFGREANRDAGMFGLGFAAIAAMAFVATVSPAHWLRAQCDAYSIAQALPAILGGSGLAILAALNPASRGTRLAGLAALGVAAALLILIAFPQCLGDPYAGVNERLRVYWLDEIGEARSALDLYSVDPVSLARSYATPVLALLIVALAWRKRTPTRPEWIVGLMLAAAFAVSLWQVRGAVFALPLAAIPLAAWVAEWRARAATEPAGSSRAAILAGLAWLMSFNLVWATAANAAMSSLAGLPAKSPASDQGEACYSRSDYDALRAMPTANILAISNLGASILGSTGHHAFAGPYHRNTTGNLLAIDIWLADARDAEALVRKAGVDVIAICPGNPESRFLAQRGGGGLLMSLLEGQTPSWLELVETTEKSALRLYLVR